MPRKPFTTDDLATRSDEELVELTAGGDAAAVELFVLRHRDWSRSPGEESLT
jgi:hypothetical protein